MPYIENTFFNSNVVPPLENLVISQRLKIVSILAVGILTLLILSLSTWANVKVASMYGTTVLLKHSAYTTWLPLGIAFILVGTLLLTLRRASEVHARNFEPMLSASPTAISYTVVAPMFGQCYLKCAVGDAVQKGDILCELEAMKLIHSMHAEEAGKIVEIFVPQGAIIAAGQPIMRYAPAHSACDLEPVEFNENSTNLSFRVTFDSEAQSANLR